MARLDSSVRRILDAKARAGVQRSRFVSLEEIDNVVGRRAHTELAAHVAERSITLVRDERGLVPFARDSARVLVLVHASPNDPISGRVFANELRGAGHAVQMLRVDARATPEETQRARAMADNADLIVAATFVMPMEGTGTVGARGPYAALVQELAEQKRPLVAISFGSPYLLDAFPAVSSYMLAWSNADVSQIAAARALMGDASITGKLPVSLPPYHQRGEGLERGLVSGTR
jgi:beta-N-acetylhexosaminidase